MHSRALDLQKNVVHHSQSMISNNSNSQKVEFDKRKIEATRDGINRMMERITSQAVQNQKDTDSMIEHSLVALQSELKAVQLDMANPNPSVRAEIDQELSKIASIEEAHSNHKRDDILNTLYEFFKRDLQSSSFVRKTVREQVFDHQASPISTQMLIANAVDAYKDKPYYYKVQHVAEPLVHSLEATLEKMNSIKANLNTVKSKNNGIGVGLSQPDPNEVRNLFNKIVDELIMMSTTFYSILMTDVGLFYALVGKSLQHMNGEISSSIKISSNNYIEAQSSSMYLDLVKHGEDELPKLIDIFLQNLRPHLTALHRENVDAYLAADFNSETSEVSEEEVYRTVIIKNSRAANKAIDLAVDRINTFLAEVNRGRNRNGINYNIFNKAFSQMMIIISNKISLIEEYKKFIQTIFEPKNWRADKKRITDMTQIVYDLTAVEQDPTIIDSKKFNIMRDYMDVLKGQMREIAVVISSAERSPPEIKDIIRTYINTMKGFLSSIRQYTEDSPDTQNRSGGVKSMVQILRKAKLDKTHGKLIEITPQAVNNAHKIQLGFCSRVFRQVEVTIPDMLVDKSKNQQLIDAFTNYENEYNALLKKPEINSVFIRFIEGTQPQADYNDKIFQGLAPDVIALMKEICLQYQLFDLNRIRADMEKYSTPNSARALINTWKHNLEGGSRLVNSNSYSRVLSLANKNQQLHRDLPLRIETLGQKLVDYSSALQRIMDQAVSLALDASVENRKKAFQFLTREMKSKQDRVYGDMDNVLVGWLRQKYRFDEMIDDQINERERQQALSRQQIPHQGNSFENHMGQSQLGGSALNGNAGGSHYSPNPAVSHYTGAHGHGAANGMVGNQGQNGYSPNMPNGSPNNPGYNQHSPIPQNGVGNPQKYQDNFGNSQLGNSQFGNNQYPGQGNSPLGNSQLGNSQFGNNQPAGFGNSQLGNSQFGNNQPAGFGNSQLGNNQYGQSNYQGGVQTGINTNAGVNGNTGGAGYGVNATANAQGNYNQRR